MADNAWVTAASLAARVPFAWLGCGEKIHSIADDRREESREKFVRNGGGVYMRTCLREMLNCVCAVEKCKFYDN